MNTAVAEGFGIVKSNTNSWCVALGPLGTTTHRNDTTKRNATTRRTVLTTAETAVETATVVATFVS